MRSVLAAVLIVGLFGVGCTEDWEVTDRGPIAFSTSDRSLTLEGPGTDEMAAVLRAIYKDALSHPMDFDPLNQHRIDVLANQIEEDAFVPRSRRLQFARELIFAGENRRAVQELMVLLDVENLDDIRATPSTKPILDLLGAAYLHLEIQQNCVDEHASESCILPMQGDGSHKNGEGARSASLIYEEILSKLPSDYQSRWLLNMARAMLDEYPAGVRREWRVPGFDVDSSGSIRRFREVAHEAGVDDRGLAGGTSVEDFNNDGFLDILATSYGLNDQTKLFLNDGVGGFVDRTESAGLEGLVGGLNTVHADYNNDGYEDVFILRGAWLGQAGEHPNSLLRNNGDGTFTDVTYDAGLDSYHPTQTGAWRDFDQDGRIDLFVGNEARKEFSRATGKVKKEEGIERPSALYRNNGDGTFTDVAEQVGLKINAFVKGATWGDVNNDGYPDLYVSVLGKKNRLFVNRGGDAIEEWEFEERALEAGVGEPAYSFSVWFWDYNNDGYEDLFVSGFDTRYRNRVGEAMAVDRLQRKKTGVFREVTRPYVYRNEGDGTFTEVSGSLNLDTVTFTMGANYGDLDNDGYLDVYAGTGAPSVSAIVPNRMFRNQGGGRFRDVSAAGGFAHIQKGHAVGFGDFDNDGDQDIYSVMGGAVQGDAAQNVLFENPGHGNQWITLDLEGRSANRSAVGARIRVVAERGNGGRRILHRTVSTGGSFGASSLRQEIGLGAATHVDTLQIEWPNRSRTVDTYTDLEVNQHLKIIEGRAHPKQLDRRTVSLGE